ncbi:MAG: TonB-dependent receptor, partial [Bacteroidota bacterium]
MKNVFLLPFLFGLFLSLSADAQLTIRGKVEEEGTGETLPYATVVIEGTSRGTTTNVDGFFTLLDVNTKDVTLKITYIGFEALVMALPDNYQGDILRIEMKPLSAELKEVVVTADGYKVLNATSGVSKSTLSTKQLSLLPNIGETDIFRSLQLLPGVSGTNENSSGLFVRGGTPDQNLVLLDGMTIYKVDHFFGFFSAFNANAVKDVQLYKGAFPAKYGGRTSSVVDLTGKTGSFQKFGGGLNLNFLSVNGYAEIPVSDKISILLAGRRSYTDVLRSGLFQRITENLIGQDNLTNPNIDPANITQVQPDFYFYDWNAKVSYKPSINDIVTFNFFNGQDFLDESRVVNQSNTRVSILADLGEQTDWGNQGASLKWSRQWNAKFY